MASKRRSTGGSIVPALKGRSERIGHGWFRPPAGILLLLIPLAGFLPSCTQSPSSPVSVVVGPSAPELEQFAASELCGYLEQLFDVRVRPVSEPSASTEAVLLLGSPETNPLLAQALPAGSFPELTDQGLVLRTIDLEGRPALVVGGGSPRATLWAVYELAERWGVRYLIDRDVLPPKRPFQLPQLDAVMEPVFRVRAHPTIQDLVASMEGWGISDFRPLIDQLAKMKFTRINVYAFGWQPYLHWEHKGIERSSAHLWYGYHYPITPDTIGRSLFGNVSQYWNRDLPLTSSYPELIEAGQQLVRNLMDHIHKRGMETAYAAPVIDFPPEFAPLLDGAEQSAQLSGMSVVPGQDTPLEDPELFGLSAAVLRATLNSYPKTDVITVFMPEFRQWIGEYERAWEALDEKYGVGELLSLSRITSAVQHRKGSEGSPERALNELKGDIANLYFFDRLLRDPEVLKGTSRSRIRVNCFGVSEELYPILDRIWPADWTLESMPSNQPVHLLRRIEILKDLPSQVLGILNLTLDDDNIGVMPQLTTNSLYEIIQVMHRHGWQGVIARERFPGDHDWPLAYLARASWDPDITPDAVARDQLKAICGEGCVEDMLAAYHEVEAVTIALARSAFAFPADWPPATSFSPGGMLMKYWYLKDRATPPYVDVAHEGYSRALESARKARAQATPEGRWYVDFWVGRLEFAQQYVEAVQAVHRSATAFRSGDRAGAVKEADQAMAVLRKGLEAYVPVVRNRTDLAAIALVNQSYRQLFQRRWSVKTWGY